MSSFGSQPLQKWQKFLDSLATKGGNLFVLSLFVVTLLFLTVWVTWRGAASSQAATVILSVFNAFGGALLLALKGGSDSRPPTNPGGTSE